MANYDPKRQAGTDGLFSTGALELGQVSHAEQRGLYWASVDALGAIRPDGLIEPQRWVRGQPAWDEVSRAGANAEALTDLIARRATLPPRPPLEKLIAETVYEDVRRSVLPKAPSRLDCLFAGGDLVAATEFAAAYIGAGMLAPGAGALPVSTADGAWVPVDMRLFEIPASLPVDRLAVSAALRDLRTRVERYWGGEQSAEPLVEVLAEKLWLWTRFLEHPSYEAFISDQKP